MPLRAVLAALLVAAAAIPAFATSQERRNLTDLWLNPAESGWGLNVIHQGDTLFATLFVYGPDGQPKWYVASNLTGARTTHSGELYECTGPWFGGPFDPKAVACRQVGTMTFSAVDATGSLDYTIDGVRVTKTVSRFSFRASSIAGSYVGFMLQPGITEIRKEQAFQITDDGSSVTMATQNDAEGPCTWTGSHGQDGQYETVSGTFNCSGRTGPWSMKVDPTSEGFTGSFAGDGIGGFLTRIAAAQRGRTVTRGNGWPNDMWFKSDESGWGLNVIEQGDPVSFSIFATLFVYDRQGKPHWYVASNVERYDLAGDQTTYLGTLLETTGPYFGAASFDPGAVTRRPVGTLTFTTNTTNASSGGRVGYTIDGVQVVKQVDRLTFRKNSFTGTYWGHQVADASDPRAGAVESMRISIDDAAAFVMHTNAASGSCDYNAPPAQYGDLRIMTGTYSCSNGRSGAFTMSDATVSFDGFTAHFQGNGIVSGHMEGVRIEANSPDAP